MENKNNKLTKILIIIIVILVLALGFYILYDQGIIFSKNNDQEKTNEIIEDNIEPEEEEEIVEKELTDRNIINILDENTKDISIGNYNPTVIENLYKEEKTTYISDEDKFLVTLFNVEWSALYDDVVENSKYKEELEIIKGGQHTKIC